MLTEREEPELEPCGCCGGTGVKGMTDWKDLYHRTRRALLLSNRSAAVRGRQIQRAVRALRSEQSAAIDVALDLVPSEDEDGSAGAPG